MIEQCNYCGSREYALVNQPTGRCLTGDFHVIQGQLINVRCLRCGLIYNRTMMDTAQVTTFYGGYTKKTQAEDNDDLLFSADAGVETLTHNQADYLVNELSLPPAARMLDIGCGKGILLKALQRSFPDAHCFGIEPSTAAVDIARRTLDFTIYEGLFGEVELEPESFDLITITHVLEHMPDPFRSLREIYRLLKPGGHVFVEVPNVLDLNMFYDLLLYEHLYHFSPVTLLNMLKTVQLEVTSTQFHTSYGAQRVIARKAARQSGDSQPIDLNDSEIADVTQGLQAWHQFWDTSCRVANYAAQQSQQGKRVALFGAGMTTACLLTYTNLADAPLVGLLDENQWKIGEAYFGQQIYSLADVKSLALDLVVIATMPNSQPFVERKLQSLGLDDLRVIRVNDDRIGSI